MKTLDELISEYEELEAFVSNLDGMDLAGAVFAQLACEDLFEFQGVLQDVLRGGADAGFSGFTYSRDCLEFWLEYKPLMLEALEEMADSLGGGGVLAMVKGFNCLNNEYSEEEIAKVLWADSEDAAIVDALAWFALEEVARAADC